MMWGLLKFQKASIAHPEMSNMDEGYIALRTVIDHKAGLISNCLIRG